MMSDLSCHFSKNISAVHCFWDQEIVGHCSCKVLSLTVKHSCILNSRLSFYFNTNDPELEQHCVRFRAGFTAGCAGCITSFMVRGDTHCLITTKGRYHWALPHEPFFLLFVELLTLIHCLHLNSYLLTALQFCSPLSTGIHFNLLLLLQLSVCRQEHFSVWKSFWSNGGFMFRQIEACIVLIKCLNLNS